MRLAASTWNWRTRDWLERDQLSYWQMQVKRRHEAMMMARTELFRRKISQQGSDAVSDTEQKEALERPSAGCASPRRRSRSSRS